MTAPTTPPRRGPSLRVLALLALLLLVAAPLSGGWLWYRAGRSITDDAFVESHLVNLGPQLVSGHLVRYLVQEHDTVAAGQLLAEIDPVPYRDQVNLLTAKLAVAEAQRAAEQAALVRLQAEVPVEVAVAKSALAAAQAEEGRDGESLKFTTADVEKAIDEAQAALEASRAALTLAEEEYRRFSTLFRESAVPERRAQEATKGVTAARADVRLGEARLARARATELKVAVARQTLLTATRRAETAARSVELAATRELTIQEAQRQVAVKAAQVEETRRALDVARTDLRYCRIVAPFPGVVVHLYRHLGDFVPTGTPVMSMYNPELTYVTAHLEETKLRGVAPGNVVRLDIDAFAEPFAGRVVWINRATGANFALVPRNLSSGEFTRVVQRVPVRIAIDRDERWDQLRPGLSVTVAIRHGPGDPDRARRDADAMRRLESAVRPADE